jgi:hypothetical protein
MYINPERYLAFKKRKKEDKSEDQKKGDGQIFVHLGAGVEN